MQTTLPVRRTEWLTLALAYAGFIGLGLINSRLNVAWPDMRATFGLPIDALGVLLIANTIGYGIASAGSGRLVAQMNLGVILAASCGIAGAGMIATGAAPSWILLIALSACIGIGAGAIDASLNAHAAAHFSPRVTNWLHACFGIGATLGPAIMTVAVAGNLGWRAGFVVLGAIQIALAICYALTRGHWTGGIAHTGASKVASGPPLAATLRLPVMWLGILIFFASTGVGVSAGQWIYSLLTESRGVSPAVAGAWASMFWGSTAIGRVLFGFVVQRVAPLRVLWWSMAGTVLGTLLLWVNITPWLTFFAIALLGLMMAPQFPLLISATPRYLGREHAANGIGLQVAAAGPGAVVVAGLIGVLAERVGLEVVGPSLVIMALVTTGLFALLARRMQEGKQ
ncbi:MAG TPA: MFS transporter [Roseiflexaceae bacterium]|nr:MFS transporter [Roseiflexaceae bacterium]